MRLLTPILLFTLLLSACNNSKKDFDATGTFESTEITISSEVAGKIINLDIEEGDSVKALSLVGTIDSTQLYLSKLQLKKNASSIRSNRPAIATQIATIRNQIAKQVTERKRIENLLDAKAATQKQLDDINSSITILESQLSAQLSTLNNSVSSIDAQSSAVDIQVAQIDDKINKCNIISPVSGTILNKYVETGELASPGQPIFKVASMTNIFLRAYVTSDQLSKIKLQQSVKVFADFGGNNLKEYNGHITWISDKSEFTPKSIQTRDERANLVYAIKIAVKNDGIIKLGMYGEVQF
ncbi:MAG: HlyD family efflux transporter periplasmic adaptor subunit [Muribaculaceae bacterium]